MGWKTGLLLVAAIAALGVVAAPEASEAPAEAPDTVKAPPLRIPDSERSRKNPVSRSEESVEHGMMLFTSQCAMCHGKAGRGGGDLAKSIGVSVPDFKSADRISKRTDGELFYIITNGCGDMPADGERLEPNWRWDMVNAIRVLSQV